MVIIRYFLIFVFCGFFGHSVLARQEVEIKIGRTEIGANEQFQIEASVTNDRLRECSTFPEIKGMRKTFRSSGSSTTIINGRMSSTETVTQNYVVLNSRQGSYRLPAFKMIINGKEADSPGAMITVGSPRQVRDPFEEFWGGRTTARENKPDDFLDLKADAFFAVNTDKSEVYVGEGFNLTLAFYIGEDNQAIIDFSEDISQQLSDILKKVKPAGCWEENFGIDEITPVLVNIGQKKYRQYKIFEANYYPLNAETVQIPSAAIKMVERKVSKQRGFFGPSYAREPRIFNSAPKSVSVKSLPPHPLRGQVAVGNFRLEESLNSRSAETGENLNYRFRIVGEGNISGAPDPTVKQSDNFDIYPPEVNRQVSRNLASVFGSTTYDYQLIPQEPGNYRFGDVFSWIFFNPKTETYDTLRSEIRLNVSGESLMNETIRSGENSAFSDLIAESDNSLRSLGRNYFADFMVNGTLFSFLLVGVWLTFVFRKKRKEKKNPVK